MKRLMATVVAGPALGQRADRYRKPGRSREEGPPHRRQPVTQPAPAVGSHGAAEKPPDSSKPKELL